jgi:hypothetical protein
MAEEASVAAVETGFTVPRSMAPGSVAAPAPDHPGPAKRGRRLRGSLAVLVVAVLMVAAVATGAGVPTSVAAIHDVGAWLANSALGSVTHAEGPSGRADATVGLPGTQGDQLRITQSGSIILAEDTRTGKVYRINPAQLTVTQSATYGRNAVQVVAGGGEVYIVAPAAGLVQQINPDTLATVGSPLRLGTRIGPAAVTAHGMLWVTLPGRGVVMPVQNGVPGAVVTVGKPGDLLGLTVEGNQPVVTDATAATMTITGSGGATRTVALPGALRQSAPPAPLVPPATSGNEVPVVVPKANQLVIVNTAAGSPTAVTLGTGVNDTLGAPEVLGQRVYVPDESTGSLITYDTATGRLLPPVMVTGRPGPLDVFVNDGMLWANDPNGPAAVAVNASGGIRDIGKYSGQLPGGHTNQAHHRPAAGANPGTGTGTGTSPVQQPTTAPPQPVGPTTAPPHPAAPSHPATPSQPAAPPQPPGAPAAASGPGWIKITFTPSSGGTPTRYTLVGAPAGATVSPASVPASGSPFAFTVTGLSCAQQYSFAVAADYARGATRSSMTAAMRPCVAPSAPRSLAVTATANHTMTLGWSAPASDGGGGTVSYNVSWNGATSGSQAGVTATSYQITGLTNSSTYSYTVAAVNPAGASQPPAAGSQALTPPSGSYNTYRNTALLLNVRSQPTQNSSSVATIPPDTGGGLGPAVTVYCQVTGGNVTDPYDKTLTGDLWDKVTYNGITGYLSDLYVNTPQSQAQNYNSFSDPPLWQCQ